MRFFNSLIVPKNVKEGPLGFFNIHSAAKPKKIEGGPLKTLKNEKSFTKLKKGPFWVLHFKVEAFGCVQNQVLSTFGKRASFTKSGTYAMSEKSDEKKKKNKTGSSQVGAISKAQKYSKNNYWKHSEFFFRKKYFFKKDAQCRKTQKEAIQAH